MKPKKSAFANSSTGYGKNHYKQIKQEQQQQQQQNNSNSKKSDLDIKNAVKKTKEEKLEDAVKEDQDLNSGFGDYLRTPEAVEMMKLFVFANTIMLIMTMMWPNLKEQYYWFRHWLASFESA